MKYCDICSTSCSIFNYDEHLRGKKHSKLLITKEEKKLYEIYTEVLKQVELKNIMSQNSHFLQKIIISLRNIKKYVTYTDEDTDSSFDILKEANNLNKGFFAKNTVGDGNCFYRSVSYILFGTEDNFYIIKLCCIFISYEYENFFTDYMKKTFFEESYNEFFKKICKKNEWADELVFVSAAILLNRPIFSFSVNKKSRKPFVQKFCFKVNDVKPILIGYQENHFVPILQKENHMLPKNIKYFEVMIGISLNIDLYC